MKKYKLGNIIASVEDLIKEKGVFMYITGFDGHWKYINNGWFRSFQLNYILNQMGKGYFRYAEKLEVNNDNSRSKKVCR